MKDIITQAKEIRAKTVTAAQTLPDETALDSLSLFDEWATYTGKSVTVGLRVRYNDTLYQVVQAHTVQDGWTPDATPALWKRVSIDEWPEWRQPAGQHDSYAKGDKVTYNGKKWVSTADNNVWAPGVYGWTEQK